MPAQPKFTAQEVADAVRKNNGRLFRTAKYLKCHFNTVKNYRAKYKIVQDAFTEMRGLRLDTSEDKLDVAVKKGEAWAIKYTLSTQGKRRGYVERTEHRHGGDKKAPPIGFSDSSMNPIEIHARIVALLKVTFSNEPSTTADPGPSQGDDARTAE